MNFSRSIIIGFVLFFSACSDAPRDNPLDPLSPRYQSNGAVSGKVYVLNQNTAVVQARVTCLRERPLCSHRSTGAYQFLALGAGSLTFVSSKDGFVSDTQKIVLQAGTPQQIQFGLNGYPFVISQNILTRKIDQYHRAPVLCRHLCFCLRPEPESTMSIRSGSSSIQCSFRWAIPSARRCGKPRSINTPCQPTRFNGS